MSQPTVNIGDKAPATLGGVFPILRVADLEASLRYYETQLGFEVQWRSGAVASVQRDRAAIMLCQGDQGHAGTWLWIAVSDADSIYTELQARGARLRHAPANYPWGSRECQIMDFDEPRAAVRVRPSRRRADGRLARCLRAAMACRTQVEAGAKDRCRSDDSQAHETAEYGLHSSKQAPKTAERGTWARSRPGQPPQARQSKVCRREQFTCLTLVRFLSWRRLKGAGSPFAVEDCRALADHDGLGPVLPTGDGHVAASCRNRRATGRKRARTGSSGHAPVVARI